MPDIKIKRQKLTTPVEEAYKLLRTNLFFCGRDKKVIAVTSCTMNEGKSTVSMNLALSLEEAGKKVILIDADLRNSTLLGKLRCTGEKYGLAYYLSDMVTFDQVICSTDYENLDIIMTLYIKESLHPWDKSHFIMQGFSSVQSLSRVLLFATP